MSISRTFALAWQHYEAGRLPQAEQLCRQIVQANATHSGALHLLGMIASRAARSDQAIDFFQAALRLDPDFADAWIDLAIELTIQGKRAEAVDAFRQALRIRPDDARAHFSLGVAWQLQGTLDLAAASFRRAVQIQPEHADVHCRLGYSLLHQGQPKAAIASLRQALTPKGMKLPRACITPWAPPSRHWDKFDEAVTHFQEAIRQRPRCAQPSYHSALILAWNYHPRHDQRAIQTETRRLNQQHASPLQKDIQPHSNTPDPTGGCAWATCRQTFTSILLLPPRFHCCRTTITSNSKSSATLRWNAQMRSRSDCDVMPITGAARWGSPTSRLPT